MPLHRSCLDSLSKSRPLIASVLLASTALAVGCGESGSHVEPVSGRVTLDGKPLPGARLMFQPEAAGGSPSYGTTNQEGRYDLGYKRGVQGAQIGLHTVRIQPGADADGSTPRKLPTRYNTQSELHREVKGGGDNVIDFELESKSN